MIVAFAVLVFIFIILTLVRSFRNRNWKLIWSSFGYEDYYKVMAKLKNEGISCKVETPHRGIDSRTESFKDTTQYDIYVKKDEEHKAIAAIHRNN